VSDRPAYDEFTNFRASRDALATSMARQALLTTRPWLPKPATELDVLDVGSGYGGTSMALAQQCASVVALEPAAQLHESAVEAAGDRFDNLELVHGGIEELAREEAFDLVVLDNVYEHLPDQEAALAAVTRAMRPGGVLYLLVPNKLWPVEAHYKLPFLSWLPLRWANRYLRWSGRGTSYDDASYAPTYWSLRRALGSHPELDFRFVLPGDPVATKAGRRMHYRLGMWFLGRVPSLWCISKALLVVAVKRPE
jgi:SAM-dependent methyltransferase